MTAPTFLTQEELSDLTGFKLARKQAAWLKSHGWQYETDAKQRPKVLRIAMLARLGGLDTQLTAEHKPEPQMRFNRHETKKKTAQPTPVHVSQTR